VKLVLAAVLSLTALVFASGCGTETVDPSEIAAAADASSSAGGAKLVIDGEGEARGQTFDIKGTGEMDERGRSEMEIEVPGAGEIEQVADGLVLYQKIPGAREQFGKEWTRVDMVEAYRQIGVDLELIQQPGSQDPRQLLAQMKNTAGEIERVGTEEVRGVETTHYKGDVDLRKAIDQAPPDKRDEAERSIEKIIDITGAEGFPMEVWVDDDKLVRKLRMQMKLNNPAFGGEMDMDMSMELFDYGTQVTIDVPAEDEAKDLTDLVAQQLE